MLRGGGLKRGLSARGCFGTAFFGLPRTCIALSSLAGGGLGGCIHIDIHSLGVSTHLAAWAGTCLFLWGLARGGTVGRSNVDVRIIWLGALFALEGFASFVSCFMVRISWPATHLGLGSLSRGGFFVTLLILLTFVCFAVNMPGP